MNVLVVESPTLSVTLTPKETLVSAETAAVLKVKVKGEDESEEGVTLVIAADG